MLKIDVKYTASMFFLYELESMFLGNTVWWSESFSSLVWDLKHFFSYLNHDMNFKEESIISTQNTNFCENHFFILFFSIETFKPWQSYVSNFISITFKYFYISDSLFINNDKFLHNSMPWIQICPKIGCYARILCYPNIKVINR